MSSGQAWHSVSQPSTAAPQHELLEKLAEVANRAKNFTGATGAAIALPAGKQFLVCSAIGTSLDSGHALPLPANFSFRTQKNNVLRCPDTDKDVTIDGQVCHAARIKSMLVAPIGDLSSLQGVVAVFSSAVNAFNETHVAVLKTLAEVIGNLLPEKDKLGGLLPPRSADDLLEHPFNPALDKVVTTAEAVFPSQGFGEPAKVPGMPTSSGAGRGASFSHRAPATEARRPEPPKMPSLPKPAIPPPSSLTTKSRTDLLNLASEPLAGTLFTGKAARSTYVPVGTVKNVGSRKIYAVVAMAVVAFGLAWLAFGNFAGSSEEPAQALSSAPPVVDAAPPVTSAPAPVGTAAPQAQPVKNDVVPGANAATLPPAASSQRAAQTPATPKTTSATLTAEQVDPEPIVVSQGPAPSRAPLITKQQEEVSPEVSVVSGPTGINDALSVRTSTAAPTLKRVVVLPSEVISKVAPVYPANAKRYGFFGAVVLSAKVNKNGSVSDVRVVSGNPVLGDAAVDAVKRWRYKPATSDGVPMDSTVNITVNFNPPR